MDSSPAKRFVDVLARLGYTTQQQIADVLGVKRPTAGTIVRMTTEPSFSAVTALKQAHPEVNIDWVFSGDGSVFLTGDTKPVILSPTPKDPPVAQPVVKGPQLVAEAEYIQEIKESREEARRNAEEWKMEAKYWQDLYMNHILGDDHPQASQEALPGKAVGDNYAAEEVAAEGKRWIGMGQRDPQTGNMVTMRTDNTTLSLPVEVTFTGKAGTLTLVVAEEVSLVKQA